MFWCRHETCSISVHPAAPGLQPPSFVVALAPGTNPFRCGHILDPYVKLRYIKKVERSLAAIQTIQSVKPENGLYGQILHGIKYTIGFLLRISFVCKCWPGLKGSPSSLLFPSCSSFLCRPATRPVISISLTKAGSSRKGLARRPPVEPLFWELLKQGQAGLAISIWFNLYSHQW